MNATQASGLCLSLKSLYETEGLVPASPCGGQDVCCNPLWAKENPPGQMIEPVIG